MEQDLLRLDRMGSTQWGTFGVLRMPDRKTIFRTVEQPWESNAVGKSCIPAGEYGMSMRPSPMVERTSGGLFHAGWEVVSVPGRSLIMIHPGNWSRMDVDGDGVTDFKGDTEGCILVGRAFAIIDCKPGVTSSRAAFKDLMNRLATRDDWRILIRWVAPE